MSDEIYKGMIGRAYSGFEVIKSPAHFCMFCLAGSNKRVWDRLMTLSGNRIAACDKHLQKLKDALDKEKESSNE